MELKGIQGYTSRVIGVIDAELLELWGYKVITQGGWSYREYRVITPGLSELLTQSYRSYGVISHPPWGMTL